MAATGAARDMADVEIVHRFRQTGDRDLFEELYRRHRRRTFGVCIKILGDPSRAEDACHDAFTRAYERFSSLRGDNFAAWVKRIAANRCYDALRQSSRLESREDMEEPLRGAIGPTALRSPVERDAAITRQELEAELDIIRSLDPHQRQVFLLFHLAKKSYREIETSTGYSAKQVKSYLQNARRNLYLAWNRLQSTAGADSDE